MAEKKDGVAKQAAKQMEPELEEGFRGHKVDPTPNENYTASGVTSGKPTPETDDDLYLEAEEATKRGVGRGRATK